MTAAVVEGYFEIIRQDLEAARRLMEPVPRAAAFHIEQAAEKLVKAILVAEGHEPGTSHDIAQLADRLPPGHEWKADLAALSPLGRFATAFRYPTATGRVPAPPARAELERYVRLVQSLCDEAADWCRGRS